MTVKVNNDVLELKDAASVADLLEKIQLQGKKGFALAVNDTVVPKAAYDKHQLNPNDNILIIKATQGG